MNLQEALNILRPEGNKEDDLKKAYRTACKKYHPDYNKAPEALELMKLINLAYEFLKKHLNKWSFEQQTDEQGLDEILAEKFDLIKTFVGIKAEVCGSWLWVSGNTFTYKKYFKEYGFRWAPKKKSWYWRPEGYVKRGKKVFSMNEIRDTYGSYDLDQENQSALG